MTIPNGGGITGNGAARRPAETKAADSPAAPVEPTLQPALPPNDPQSDSNFSMEGARTAPTGLVPSLPPQTGHAFDTAPSEPVKAVPGQPLPPALAADVPAILAAYDGVAPDPSQKGQRVVFGTSGHRGTSLNGSFNRPHIVSIAQAVCDHRAEHGTTGPTFVGADTHALSGPALESVLDVLRANGVETITVPPESPYSPTPVISHAILAYNRGRSSALADGIIITPSHNPPRDGGIKYNEPHGGPAADAVTKQVEARANRYLDAQLSGVRTGGTVGRTGRTEDLIGRYVADLVNVIDFDAIRAAKVRMAIDPLGGASVDTWRRILEHHDLGTFTLLNTDIDPAFRRLPADHDGKVRMDPSSAHVMAALVRQARSQGIVIGANDTDADRHGIVTPQGLLNPNHYLAVCAHYLFTHRPGWGPDVAIGKTLVSSAMIDRVAEGLGRTVVEVPVGFKWFVDGLYNGQLGMAGEESAGMSFLRRDGTVWTTEKDGPIAVLLAAEMMAKTGRDPAEIYAKLTRRYGTPVYQRRDAPATDEQRAKVAALNAGSLTTKTLAGDPILQVLTTAPGNGASIGGLKVVTQNGWFAVRPSGTEPILKVYGESLVSAEHLERIFEEAQALMR